ncbi:hypothetical protein TrVE_jg4265 [Triparma verrucosa]|uniref:V-type proton ATPase proteolipid subunit n=2 Tax=Triparma TaxID=722752 RepID=A0A9W7BZ38_9STRA|nr:hypothetical protein TrST_g1551 [Triparma strigata]GMI12995.1 hypothetical protein TrVE_jg4265 [Triparma verrucosa]
MNENYVAGFDACPTWSPVLGYAGAAICIIFANWGAAVGTWKCGLGLCGMGINHPNGIIKNLIGIIMAGVLGIFGLIVAIILGGGITGPDENGMATYSQFNGWSDLAAGVCCGATCLAAGYATGIAGETSILAVGVRAMGNKHRQSRGAPGGAGDDFDEGDASKLYIAGVTILSFAGALGLYGFIVALIIASTPGYYCSAD